MSTKNRRITVSLSSDEIHKLDDLATKIGCKVSHGAQKDLIPVLIKQLANEPVATAERLFEVTDKPRKLRVKTIQAYNLKAT